VEQGRIPPRTNELARKTPMLSAILLPVGLDPCGKREVRGPEAVYNAFGPESKLLLQWYNMESTKHSTLPGISNSMGPHLQDPRGGMTVIRQSKPREVGSCFVPIQAGILGLVG
jgi:hypothetical protein